MQWYSRDRLLHRDAGWDGARAAVAYVVRDANMGHQLAGNDSS